MDADRLGFRKRIEDVAGVGLLEGCAAKPLRWRASVEYEREEIERLTV